MGLDTYPLWDEPTRSARAECQQRRDKPHSAPAAMHVSLSPLIALAVRQTIIGLRRERVSDSAAM